VLNTPQAHRIHHACNEEYIDGNYGGVLIVFDRLFGTYKKPLENVPIRYRLKHPFQVKIPLSCSLPNGEDSTQIFKALNR
jgi:sterol desaturase/sphingolipid hydroxylase (fatty acid hydroxylase superfamily)